MLKWKKSNRRKPLVLRGARQVGKTTLIHEFAKEYDQYIHLNLEKHKDKSLFYNYTGVHQILEALLLEYDLQPPTEKKTLLFIDEIQESPEAIALLRYFYEELPELHVIAAGSLLEHALSQVKSFPVGRVNYLYIFPMNFQEYLMAHRKEALLKNLHQIPVQQSTHHVAMDYFHRYALTGGMPEVLQLDVEGRTISEINEVYDGIWSSYRDDVSKYAKNRTEENVIKHIMRTGPFHMDERVTFQHFGNSNYRSREVSESFHALDDAKVIQLIYPGTSVEFPLVTDYKKSPRLQFLDTGLLNYALGIQSTMLEIDDLSTQYKGAILPHLITQELISIQEISYQKPNFWVRQKKGSQAEVDLIYPFQGLLIPIEVKSGKVGKLRSLHQFMEQAPHPYAIRIYGGAFGIEQHRTPAGKSFYLMNMPYYLMTFIESYLEYFLENAS